MTNQPKLYMTLESGFTGLRCLNKSLIPVRWAIYIDLAATKNDENEDDEGTLASIKWQTLNFWINRMLNEIVVYDINDEWANDVIFKLDNPAMTLPGLPSDDLLVQTLFEKVNSICEDVLVVTRLSISSSDIGIIYHINNVDDESMLPDISYAGENVKTLHNKPWWRRKTSDCCDISIKTEEFNQDEETNTNVTPLNNCKKERDILEEFELQLAEAMSTGEYYFDSEEYVVEEDANEEDTTQQKNNVIEPTWNRKK